MNKSWMTKLGVVSVLGLAFGVASAQVRYQNGGVSNTGISVRLGVFFPTSSAGTSIGHEWFMGGLDYKLNSVATASPATVGNLPSFLSISGDYYEKDGNRDIPVVLNYNIKLHNMTYAVGIGAEDAQVSGSNTTIGFAAQAAISYDIVKLPIPVFAQAKYFWSDHDEFRGIGLFLGARF